MPYLLIMKHEELCSLMGDVTNACMARDAAALSMLHCKIMGILDVRAGLFHDIEQALEEELRTVAQALREIRG